MQADTPTLFSDLALSRRLERAEGTSCAQFVETHARLEPESGAARIEVAGTFVMFDGVKSPITQTFGLGLFQTITPADLEAIERFYQERSSPVFHEVSPLSDSRLAAMLCERGYHPVEYTSVLFRPIQGGAPLSSPRTDGLRARLIRREEAELWMRTSAKGWCELTELADTIQDLMRITANVPGGLSFLVELEGEAIAAGALRIHEGVALLAGASTIPEGRKKGAQHALLEARLRYAADHDCDVAMMCAAPGSISQRNAERQGFRIAYTRTKWMLPFRASGAA